MFPFVQAQLLNGAMEKYTTPENSCPACHKEINSCTSLDGGSPIEGDLSVCIGCGQLLTFNQDLSVCLLGDQIFDVIKEDPEGYLGLLKIQQAILECKRNEATDG